jgi:CheY-like chemotaxis protein
MSTALRVLVVEDHRDGREMLRLLLRCWGQQVEVARDGLEGVETALIWKPHVAIIDLGLPQLDGYQVARRLRASFAGDVRLIALTAYSAADARQRAFESGFDHFLNKPAEPGELRRLIAGTGANSESHGSDAFGIPQLAH